MIDGVGVIGLGGAGGNIADEANKMGFLTGAINFSQKDLDAIEVKHTLRLSGSEGVGKNRDIAISLIQEQMELPIKFIQDHFSNVDAIIFAFSTSGGSGSGISPMLLEIMSGIMPEKVFVAFAVIPDKSEVTVNQMNCLKAFEELSQLNIAVFPIDNEQIKSKHSNIGKNKLFELTNQKAIELLSKILSYNEKHSKNGNFDKKDLLTVLNTSGISIIAETNIADLHADISINGISKRIQQSWNDTVFTPIELIKVTRAGIIFDGQDQLMQYINHEDIFSNFEYGQPIDLFEGNYHDNKGKLFSILTGLSWCSKRMQDIEKLINDNEDKVDMVLTAQSSYKSNATSIINRIRTPTQNKKRSMADIFSKYQR